jgi:hypothetical protein
MIDLKQTLPCATFDSEPPGGAPSGRSGRKRASQHPEGRKQRTSQAPATNDWSVRGRVLVDAIEASLAQTAPPVKLIAAVERAYAAFYLEDVSEADVAHVAHLCERAYDAIRKVRPAQVEAGVVNCARVLHLGLSQELRQRVSEEHLVEVVHALRVESTRSRAVTDATMRVLGWLDKFRDRAELVVLMALREYSRKAAADETPVR